MQQPSLKELAKKIADLNKTPGKAEGQPTPDVPRKPTQPEADEE